ncbi:hypothetical protein A2635_05435 [Candidatus Peribacteria bacterium RIFCSPHIGHO2_01_FULL_51_9]|nr:MAG: hypothetical protein A2635_05435 [Candidatus Peribacteria bacterium RIFCSPHIGHO2_01_FULL_51_9]
MDQGQLKRLLVEAADPKTDGERVERIGRELLTAVRVNGATHSSILCAVHKLFHETVRSHRGYLPRLLPAFVVMCAEGHAREAIDWDLVDTR